MPFTVSHVAAVLPFMARRRPTRPTRLAPAALVIGSMVPDVPWFFTAGRGASFMHSLPGLVTVDVALGVVLVVLWRGFLFAPVRDLVPPTIGRRLPEPVSIATTRWGWAALGVLVGAATHVVWDDFTHTGRWAVGRISWLHTEHAGLAGSQWAQYASGVIGGVVVLACCARLLAQASPAPDRGWVAHAQRWQALVTVALAGLLGAGYGAWTALGPGIESLLFRAVTRGGAAAAGTILLVCLLWWVRRPRRTAGERPAGATAAQR
jgi:hypothetical protein